MIRGDISGEDPALKKEVYPGRHYDKKVRDTQQKRKKPVIVILTVTFCAIVFCTSGYFVAKQAIEDYRTAKIIDQLRTTETPTDPGTEPPTIPVIQPGTEPGTSEPTDSATEPGTESTEPPTEQKTEDIKEVPTLPATERPTEKPTEPPRTYNELKNTEIHPDLVDLDNIPYLNISAEKIAELREQSSQFVCWFSFEGPTKDPVKGLPIDIPAVKTTDNSFYLDHDFNRKNSGNGWVYMDYRNKSSLLSNRNSIFYGHAKSYKMFGGLKYLNERPQWYKNGYNHFIRISTPEYDTVWQVFSWYETDIYDKYITTYFPTDQDFIDFCYERQEKNQLKGWLSEFEFDKDSHIVTLSTCKGSDKNVRVAVHAVLVKSQKRQ